MICEEVLKRFGDRIRKMHEEAIRENREKGILVCRDGRTYDLSGAKEYIEVNPALCDGKIEGLVHSHMKPRCLTEKVPSVQDYELATKYGMDFMCITYREDGKDYMNCITGKVPVDARTWVKFRLIPYHNKLIMLADDMRRVEDLKRYLKYKKESVEGLKRACDTGTIPWLKEMYCKQYEKAKQEYENVKAEYERLSEDVEKRLKDFDKEFYEAFIEAYKMLDFCEVEI